MVVVTLVAAAIAPGLLNGNRPTPAQGQATPVPAVAPSFTSMFAISSRPLATGECGEFSATSPTSTFGTQKPRAIRRIDTAVTTATDRWWMWCVAGARVYDDGIEVVGRFVLLRDASSSERPRIVLRSASFGGQIEGYGMLGPAELGRTVDGFSLLRLPAVTDDRRRSAFMNASDRASSLVLRIVGVSGPWSFDPVALQDGPLDVSAGANGVDFRLRDLKVLPDGIAARMEPGGYPPDPAVASMEWDVKDDAGTAYRPVAGLESGVGPTYRAFAPTPPPNAAKLTVSIRRLYLSPLREFAVTLPLVP